MNHLPLIQQLADIEKLQQLISQSKPYAVLHQWAETAGEIEPKKRGAIHNIRSIYAEMDESMLDTSRLLLFIETILEKLSGDEDRYRLITLQAINARKNAA